jgi:hypothetical protein
MRELFRVETLPRISRFAQRKSIVLPTRKVISSGQVLYIFSASWPDLLQLLQWDVLGLDNGRYRLIARGAPTGEQDDLLYAFLFETESEKAEEWVITKREENGHLSLYT